MSLKSISWLYITFVTLLLTGCAITEDISLEIPECEGGSQGLDRCDVRFTSKFNSVGGGFDSAKLIIDTSQSTLDFAQNLLTATLVQKRNGVIVGSFNFQFEQNGQGWSPVNTQSLNSWVANNMAVNDSIEVGVSGLEFTSEPGINVLVTELVYDNIILVGASKSWYVSSQGNNQIMQ